MCMLCIEDSQQIYTHCVCHLGCKVISYNGFYKQWQESILFSSTSQAYYFTTCPTCEYLGVLSVVKRKKFGWWETVNCEQQIIDFSNKGTQFVKFQEVWS